MYPFFENLGIANKIAKKLFMKKLHTTKRAEIFTMRQIDKISTFLWKGNKISKAASCLLRITFLSGARCGDLRNVFWEDAKVERNYSGTYVLLPMRSSKTNPRSLKKEVIAIKTYKNSKWNIINILIEYKQFLIDNKLETKRIFPNKPTRSYAYYFDKGRKACKLDRKLTGHSGRNSTIKRLLLAEVKSESICVQLHWKQNSEMVFRYRDILMETTEIGAPHALESYDRKNKFNM